MAQYWSCCFLPAIPALEGAQPGQADQGQPDLPHRVPGVDRRHHRAAHDCQARGNGHWPGYDTDSCSRVYRLHCLDQQAQVRGQDDRFLHNSNTETVHSSAR